MNPLYFMSFILILLIVIMGHISNRAIAIRRKRERGNDIMALSNLITELVGKMCYISTGSFGTSYVGTVESVDEKWVKVNTGKKTVVLSLDFITSIEIRDKK